MPKLVQKKLGFVEPAYSNGFSKRTGNIQLFSVVHSWLCDKTVFKGLYYVCTTISQNVKGVIEHG